MSGLLIRNRTQELGKVIPDAEASGISEGEASDSTWVPWLLYIVSFL